MKKSCHFLALAVLFLLPASLLLAQPLDKSLLWEVSGKGLAKPSYLFGTFHILNDQYMNASQQKALDAFMKADGVVVETIVDTPAMMKAQMHMVMLDNKLSKLLDTATYRLVNQEVQRTMGTDLSAFDQLKPALVQTILSIAYITEANPEIAKFGGDPLDQYFAAEAKKSKRRVYQLETTEEQMALVFDHFTPRQQADQLAEMVRLKDKVIGLQKRLADNYLAQDIQALDALSWEMVKEMPQYGNLEYITIDRNKRWAVKLPELMKTGSLFIAVGALHLPGKDGLIDLLRKAGYTVKAVKQ